MHAAAMRTKPRWDAFYRRPGVFDRFGTAFPKAVWEPGSPTAFYRRTRFPDRFGKSCPKAVWEPGSPTAFRKVQPPLPLRDVRVSS
jgi:hypothetical protein